MIPYSALPTSVSFSGTKMEPKSLQQSDQKMMIEWRRIRGHGLLGVPPSPITRELRCWIVPKQWRYVVKSSYNRPSTSSSQKEVFATTLEGPWN